MAKQALPGPMKKREILYSTELPAEEKAAWGHRFLEAGRIMDALAFFIEAGAKEDLAAMCDRAVEEGDAFILRSVERAAPELVDAGRWEALTASARRLGMDIFAEQAERGGEVELPVVDAVIQEDPTAHLHENGEAGETESPGAAEEGDTPPTEK